jgi:alcohol dehydrogenase
LVVAAGLHVNLDQSGVASGKIEALSEAASQQWTGTFNPRDVNQESLLGIYQNAF